MSEKITDINKIRSTVERRVDKERHRMKKMDKKGGDGDGHLPSAFIRACRRTNQHGDGELFKALNKGKLLYCKNMQTWLIWDRHHWSEDIMDAALAAVERVADAYEREATIVKKQLAKADKDSEASLDELLEALEKRADSLRGDNRRLACIKFAHTSDEPLAIDGHELDLNPWLLGCRNGVVDLRTGEFRAGRPEDYILKSCPVDWESIDQPCELWINTLTAMMDGDAKMVEFLQRLFGMAICGKVVEKIFPVLIGPGGNNGKTTLIETISGVLGPLAGPVPSDMLEAGFRPNSNGIDTATMALKGLRIAYASETESKAMVRAARVKILTGNDSLTARSPYDKRMVTWAPTHTLFLPSNYTLRADSEDKAFWSRTIYIPFNVRFIAGRDPSAANERVADPHLDEKLKSEYSGILAWLVRGFLLWQSDGLQIPPKVIEESTRTRDDNDHIGAFLEECCFKTDDMDRSIGSTELYHYFEEWYKKNVGRYPPKIKTFGKYMRARYDWKKEGIMRYRGIEINWDAVRAYDPDASNLNYV